MLPLLANGAPASAAPAHLAAALMPTGVRAAAHAAPSRR
jgi:hypothetical protein